MPRRALGGRAVRPSARAGATIPKIGALSFILSDGCTPYGGQPVARDRAEAARAWPFYRRQIWAALVIGQVPQASREFDQLTTDGAAALADWRLEAFDTASVIAGLESDRAAVAAFRARDRVGAASIRAYLDAFLAHLEDIEAEARRVVAWSGPFWTRTCPQLGRGRYGSLAGGAPQGGIEWQ